ncbi:hypothetical protein [Streptomyces sp. MI02-7b]|uniref:hypothetical protein n=1 Tax=Streptomyces sp. MI02-7b TaxID=462941 RepID=UPI0029A812B0|nr:hypothetical protein [Streptomyces sp. MI02-7b]MDX3072279.1 hypothetical protein [Streptomyces sp. MI02-7b]
MKRPITRGSRVRRLLARLAAGAAVGALLGGLVAQAAQPAVAADPGNSSVSVQGRGEFKDMTFTVSQTKHLTSQAVTVSWKGGTPTAFAGTQFNTDFVQIMQCWGDDDGTVPGNPGPSRTQCQYGASPTTGRGSWPGNDIDDSRKVFYSADPTNYGQDSQYGAANPNAPGEVPFKSVDGTLITSNLQNNRLYNYNTTNEIDFARTSADGTGKEFFEVQTAYEAPHLGCGMPVTRDGHTAPRSCWLVIVPQGHLDLDGKPYADHTQVNAGSPVSSTNWKNRIAVKLDFNKVGATCALGSKERPTSGSELAADAITSWQTALCASGSVYGYTELGEPDARARLENDGDSGLVFTTRPLNATDDASYAPVALSGVVIGFTIERRARAGAPDSVRKLTGTKVESLDLTPRLVAKLLTESYRNSTWGSVTGPASSPTPAKGYGWALKNPDGLVSDPDFLTYNPEFAQLSVAETPATDTDLITAIGHSDSARAVWRWINADRDARRFLAGIPDEWGMTVNPNYSTNADVNAAGVFDPNRDDYPKSDPWCTVPPGADTDQKQCMIDFHPYVDDMHAGALHTRRADTLWKSTWDALASPPAFKSPGPQTVGSRFVLTITDAASADRYGLQTARLLNAAGAFAAPTGNALAAAATSSSDASVPEIDPATATAKDAYPLAQLVHAAVRPAALDAGARKDYANLLRFAAGAGQNTGTGPGELPPGYAPLPAGLRARADKVADALAAFKPAHSAAGDDASGDDIDGGGGGAVDDTGPSYGGTPGDPTASASVSTTPSAKPSFDGGDAVQVTANGTTPADPANTLRWAVPAGAALGAVAAVGAPFAGGAKPRLPLRVPLPGGRGLTLLPEEAVLRDKFGRLRRRVGL